MITVSYYHEGSMCSYTYEYPNVLEILEIFPEAADIVPKALRAARKRKRHIIETETKPYLARCQALQDGFSEAFWKEAYMHLARGFRSAVADCERLERLSGIMTDPSKAVSLQADILRAKAVYPQDIHTFSQLRPVRGGYTALCPIHGDKDPSFRIYQSGRWHCYGCGKGGDTIDFVMLMYKVSFRKALSIILGGSKK